MKVLEMSTLTEEGIINVKTQVRGEVDNLDIPGISYIMT